MQDPILARFVLEHDGSDSYAASVVLPISGVRIPVESKAVVSEFDYLDIDAVTLELGRGLVFSLKPAAARDFYRISVTGQGKRLVLLFNGQAVGARRIDGPVADGKIYIFIEATDAEVDAFAAKIKETNLDIQKKLSR